MCGLGKLYVVATPIGNLEDITYRAVSILKSVNYIACEDTRRVRKLLTHYGISGKRLISYYSPKEKLLAGRIINILRTGEDVALVSDAGTPGISDPGAYVVKLARDAGIDVIPVPGASSIVAALSASGFPGGKFAFVGFLPRKPADLLDLIGKFSDTGFTLVAFESPHRVLKTVSVIAEVFPHLVVGLYREITKVHEEFIYDEVVHLTDKLGDKAKGEFVVIIPPYSMDVQHTGDDRVIEILKSLKAKGLSLKEAVICASIATGLSKRYVYSAALGIFGSEG